MSLVGRLLGRNKTRWNEVWQTFPGVMDGASAVWTVDLGAIEAAPMANLPVRLDVAAHHALRGTGAATDAAHLERLVQAVRAAVSDLGGTFIGRVASGGDWRLTAHLPAQPPEPVRLRWQAPDPTYELTIQTAYDPHWAYVRDRLTPDERQSHLLGDMAVIGVLGEHGDTLATPRQVEHVAYFAEAESAESAALELRAVGFATAVERDAEGEFVLTALRSDAVAPPAVHEMTWSVKEAVERHGGTYDGWNCAVTT